MTAMDLLARVRAEIDARMAELRPVVVEYERLLRAVEALEGDLAGTAVAASAVDAPTVAARRPRAGSAEPAREPAGEPTHESVAEPTRAPVGEPARASVAERVRAAPPSGGWPWSAGAIGRASSVGRAVRVPSAAREPAAEPTREPAAEFAPEPAAGPARGRPAEGVRREALAEPTREPAAERVGATGAGGGWPWSAAGAIERAPSTARPARASAATRKATREAIVAALEHGSHTVAELVVVTGIPRADIRDGLRRLLPAGTVARARREGKIAYVLSGRA
jgi:hypothetical protein